MDTIICLYAGVTIGSMSSSTKKFYSPLELLLNKINESKSKQSTFKHIDDVIITSYTKVTIGSLPIPPKFYLNIFEKYFRLKKVSKTD